MSEFICPRCNQPLNDHGFCMWCYERVVREKPLDDWQRRGSARLAGKPRFRRPPPDLYQWNMKEEFFNDDE